MIVAEYWGLTPGMATLAVFARSSTTLAGAQSELAEWPGARWPRNTAHKHVPALVNKGWLRRIAMGNVTWALWDETAKRLHRTRRDLFDNLRVRGRVEAGDLLSSIVRELDCGVLASVSGAENALLADRVLLLREGRVLVISDRSSRGEGNVVSFPARESAAGERA